MAAEIAGLGRQAQAVCPPELALEAGVLVTAGVPGMLLGTVVVTPGTEEVPGVPAGVVTATAEQSLACEAALKMLAKELCKECCASSRFAAQ